MFDILHFENPYFILKSIGVLTGAAYLVYRFQLFTLIKSTFFDKGRGKLDIEIESKVEEYLSIHDSVIEKESKITVEQASKEPPRFHLLRTIKNENIITVYFANHGGDIFNIEVQSSDIEKISIEPKEKILNNDSGYLKIQNYDNVDRVINLELTYLDKRENRKAQKYQFSISDEKLTEIESTPKI